VKTRAIVFSLAFLVLTVALRASSLQVFAAASLTDALNEIAPAYEATHLHKVHFNFAGSNVLARQLLEGAPADVFVSADEKSMDVVQEAGLLLAESRRDLLSNTLAIVVPVDSVLHINSAQQLAGSEVRRLALADPRAVPAGLYAKEYLEKVGLWDAMKDRVIPTENVRAALAAVESGDVDAGIVYRTDAASTRAVKVTYIVPADQEPRISYPIAILKSSRHAWEARAFVAYLTTEPALAIFRKHGFLIVKSAHR
jgi:molybdate transport system substrate-binding protein